MFYNLRCKAGAALFSLLVRGILKTPPVDVHDGPVLVVSMLCHRDVRMYLVAVKSFLRQLGLARVEIIDDGSLTDEDRTLLVAHLPGLVLTHIDSIDMGSCQRGGTWERLVHILRRSRDSYVIQLDADTLALGAVDEISECIRENRSFVIGDEDSKFRTLVETAKAADPDDPHICDASERAFGGYPDAESLRFVRGSSGFSGFAKGVFSFDAIEVFHGNMEKIMGERWTEWSSEQISSNFAIANSPDPLLLPNPRYANYKPYLYANVSCHFLHFIGSFRFDRMYYSRLAMRVIKHLKVK